MYKSFKRLLFWIKTRKSMSYFLLFLFFRQLIKEYNNKNHFHRDDTQPNFSLAVFVNELFVEKKTLKCFEENNPLLDFLTLYSNVFCRA